MRLPISGWPAWLGENVRPMCRVDSCTDGSSDRASGVSS
jgi:hypothetical protein